MLGRGGGVGWTEFSGEASRDPGFVVDAVPCLRRALLCTSPMHTPDMPLAGDDSPSELPRQEAEAQARNEEQDRRRAEWNGRPRP